MCRGIEGFSTRIYIHGLRVGGEAENHMEKKWKMEQKLDYV